MSSPLIKIVEQPSMTSQQTREIKVLSLLDRFLKSRSYSLPTEKGLQRSIWSQERCPIQWQTQALCYFVSDDKPPGSANVTSSRPESKRAMAVRNFAMATINISYKMKRLYFSKVGFVSLSWIWSKTWRATLYRFFFLLVSLFSSLPFVIWN